MQKLDEELTVFPTSDQTLSDLRDLSIRCRELLHQLTLNDVEVDGPEARELVASFNIWLANMGVFREGRQSIASRLKSAPHISKLVQQQLAALRRDLENGVLGGDDQEQMPSASESNDSSDRSSTSSYRLLSPSDYDGALSSTPSRSTIWTSIQDTITSLRQLELTIRLAGAQHRQERIQSFKDLDRNIQVYRLFEKCAAEKIDYLFPKASKTLRERMVESIATRRMRIMYFERHYKKTSTLNEPAPALEQKDALPTRQPEQEQQQADRGLPPRQGNLGPSHQQSVVMSNTIDTKLDLKQSHPAQNITKRAESVSSIEISTGAFPSRPTLDPGGTSFTCPYCFLVCPEKEATGKNEWKGHLIHDFEPFFCVFDNCPSPFSCAGTYTGWRAHMRDKHTQPKWHCWHCKTASPSSSAFSSPEKLEAHLGERHKEQVTDSLRPTLVKHSMIRDQHPLRECPFCGGFPEEIERDHPETDGQQAREALEKHVRDHLISVALILAPVKMGEPGNEVNDTKSEAQRGNGSEHDLDRVGNTYELRCRNDSCDCKDSKKDSDFDLSLDHGHHAWEMAELHMVSDIARLWPDLTDKSIMSEREDATLAAFAAEFRLKPTPSNSQRHQIPLYTVGWICAIPMEYEAAKVFLDETYQHPIFVVQDDHNIYTLGRIGEHNVVIATLSDKERGNLSAATVATDMVLSFPNIKISLMVGIAGGVASSKHDIRLGDIVVGIHRRDKSGVLQCHFKGAIGGNCTVTTTPASSPLPASLRAAINALKVKYEIEGHTIKESVNNIMDKKKQLQRKYGCPDRSSDRLYVRDFVHLNQGTMDGCKGCCSDPDKLVRRDDRTEDDNDPTVHYGLIASANQVMGDSQVRDMLAEEHGILCFDVGAVGLISRFPCLVIRGICDYSDSHKNLDWQGYAAMVAAAYAKDLLNQIPHSALEARRKISDVLADG